MWFSERAVEEDIVVVVAMPVRDTGVEVQSRV